MKDHRDRSSRAGQQKPLRNEGFFIHKETKNSSSIIIGSRGIFESMGLKNNVVFSLYPKYVYNHFFIVQKTPPKII